MTTTDHYRTATDWLNENRPFVLTPVLSLGKPFYSKIVETAAVMLKNGSKDPELHMNSDFFDTLTPGQSGAVLVHEMYHVILKHLEELQDKNSYPNEKALVYAHEAVINDRLASLGYDLPDGLIFGPSTVGVDCSEMTTDEAYQLFDQLMPQEEQQKEGGSEDNENGQSTGGLGEGNSAGGGGEESEGDGSDDSTGAFGSPCDHHGHSEMAAHDFNNLLDRVEKAIKKESKGKDSDEIAEELPTIDQLDSAKSNLADSVYDDSGESPSLGAGSGTAVYQVEVEGTSESFSQEFKKILEFIDPRVGVVTDNGPFKQRRNWGYPNRRYAAYGQRSGIFLPTLSVADQDGGDVGRKTDAIFALDQSASIPRKMADVLVRMATQIPDDLFEYEVYTYADYCVPFDPKSKNNKIASGGTEFLDIHRKAIDYERRNGVYPWVVNLTDGEANFRPYFLSYPRKGDLKQPNHEQLKKWVVVDFMAHSETSVPFMNISPHFFDFAKSGAKTFSLPMGKYAR